MSYSLPPWLAGPIIVGIGLLWLWMAAMFQVIFESQGSLTRFVAKYGFDDSNMVEWRRQMRPIALGIARWIMRPIGWAVVIGGSCVMLYGCVDIINSWAQA